MRCIPAFSAFSSCTGKVLAIRSDGKFVDSVESGVEGAVLLDKTNFYAEQGGQIYDTGVLCKVDDQVGPKGAYWLRYCSDEVRF